MHRQRKVVAYFHALTYHENDTTLILQTFSQTPRHTISLFAV